MHIPHRGMKQGGLSASGKGYCDEASIYDLVQRSPTIGRRILNRIDSVLAGLGNKNARERQFLRRARSLYVSALL